MIKMKRSKKMSKFYANKTLIGNILRGINKEYGAE